MAGTKVIEKSSDKTVLSNRVGYFDCEVAPLGVFGPVAGGGVAYLLTAAISDIFFVSTQAAFEIAGPVGLTVAPLVAAFYYSAVISDKAEKFTGVRYSKWDIIKRAAASILPVGQKANLGKEVYNLSGKTEPTLLIGGSKSQYADYYGRFSKESPTHEVKTEIVFKPFGSCIKQTVIQSPTRIWDEAFESTVDVHKFRKPQAINSKPRHDRNYESAF